MFNIFLLILGATLVASEGDKTLRGSEERCYGEVGCLVLDDSWWDPLLRPVNLWPQDPTVVNTTFFMHTPARTDKETSGIVRLDPFSKQSLTLSPLDATKPTKVIIHGYREDAQVPWVVELTEALQQYGDYNIIVVNWEGGCQALYTQAVANARLVGLQTAYLLNNIAATFNLSPSSVHIIGYALGAHVAAYVGERVAGAGRITGLSPSALYFEGLPPLVRLDENDASFVDVVHTNTDGHGYLQGCGTVDFYPNGGGQQPGCTRRATENEESSTGNTSGMKILEKCSRLRAVDLFLASLTCPDCFLGHQCSDEYLYANGMCISCGEPNTQCGYLGMRAEEFLSQGKDRVPLHLITSGDPPYSVTPYLVWFNFAHPQVAEDAVEGYLYLTLKGQNSSLTTNIPGERILLNHGQSRGWVLVMEEDLGAVQEVLVRWEFDPSLFSPCHHRKCNTNLYIHTLKVSPINYLPESKRKANTRLLCGGLQNTMVPSGGVANLVAMEICQEWSL